MRTKTLQTNTVKSKKIILAGDSLFAWSSILCKDSAYTRKYSTEDFLQRCGHTVANISVGGSTNIHQLEKINVLCKQESWDLIVWIYTDEWRDLKAISECNRILGCRLDSNNGVEATVDKFHNSIKHAVNALPVPIIVVDGLGISPFDDSHKLITLRKWRQNYYDTHDLTGITSWVENRKTVSRLNFPKSKWFVNQETAIKQFYKSFYREDKLPDGVHPSTVEYQNLNRQIIKAAEQLDIEA